MLKQVCMWGVCDCVCMYLCMRVFECLQACVRTGACGFVWVCVRVHVLALRSVVSGQPKATSSGE